MGRELVLKLLQELEVEKFITHEVPFAEINKAFDYMLQGDSLRCIIRMDAWRDSMELEIYLLWNKGVVFLTACYEIKALNYGVIYLV